MFARNHFRHVNIIYLSPFLPRNKTDLRRTNVKLADWRNIENSENTTNNGPNRYVVQRRRTHSVERISIEISDFEKKEKEREREREREREKK